jgi:hypothetical protein
MGDGVQHNSDDYKCDVHAAKSRLENVSVM